VATIVICSGACLAIVIAWFMVRKEGTIESGLYLGTTALLVAGTLVWGARLGDFNTFHLFYGGLAVFGTPVAAVAVWSIWRRLRATGHVRLAIAVLVLCGTQLEFGALFGIGRLGLFGPGDHAPVPLSDPGRHQEPASGRQARVRLPACGGERLLEQPNPWT